MLNALASLGDVCLHFPWPVLAFSSLLAFAFHFSRARPPRSDFVLALLTAVLAAASLMLWHVGHAIGEEARLARAGLPAARPLCLWASRNSLGLGVLPIRAGLVMAATGVVGFALWQRRWTVVASLPITLGAIVSLGYRV